MMRQSEEAFVAEELLEVAVVIHHSLQAHHRAGILFDLVVRLVLGQARKHFADEALDVVADLCRLIGAQIVAQDGEPIPVEVLLDLLCVQLPVHVS